jgi:hypothetical protein
MIKYAFGMHGEPLDRVFACLLPADMTRLMNEGFVEFPLWEVGGPKVTVIIHFAETGDEVIAALKERGFVPDDYEMPEPADDVNEIKRVVFEDIRFQCPKCEAFFPVEARRLLAASATIGDFVICPLCLALLVVVKCGKYREPTADEIERFRRDNSLDDALELLRAQYRGRGEPLPDFLKP